MTEKLFTAVARCATCKAEINRAPGVPESEKTAVEKSAPLNCFCRKKGHNTLSGLNFNTEIEWMEGIVEVRRNRRQSV